MRGKFGTLFNSCRNSISNSNGVKSGVDLGTAGVVFAASGVTAVTAGISIAGLLKNNKFNSQQSSQRKISENEEYRLLCMTVPR